MSKKTGNGPPVEGKKMFSRYHTVNWRRYWIRNIVVAVGLFAVILWLRYPTQGPIAFLWAFGVAGVVLAYFAINYYSLRK